jgi:hypothetical protein
LDKLEQFKTSLEAFLDHTEKNVLVIKGPWGVGKTHFWDNFVKDSPNYQGKTYSYVSLFALSSLSEIQSSIFYNSSKIGTKNKVDTFKKKIKNISKYSQKIPQVNKFSDAIAILERSFLKDYLICIDDIERKDSTLSMSNVLGLISELSVGNKCKFVLIFNDDTLEPQDKQEFNKYREKVVDIELEYNPSIEHNQEIVFENHPFKEVIYKTLYPLNLKNIRILKHMRWNIENILVELSGFEKEVSNEIISITIVLTYIHHEPLIEVSVEDLEVIFSYNNDLTDEQKLQRNTIQSLGHMHFADYEKELVKYISDGVYDKEAFSKEINILNERQKQSNFQKEIEEVWGLYNNNFKATTKEVLSGLRTFLDKHVKQMSYREIEPMVSVINRIDNTAQTEVWVDRFITTKLESLSRKDIEFFKTKTKDPGLLGRLKRREAEISSSNSIKDTLYKIVKNSGWNLDDEEFLNSHSEEQLHEWLKNEDDNNLLSILRGALGIFTIQEADNNKAQFGRKLHNAVRRFANRSAIDRIRIKDFFGLECEQA